MNEDLALPKCLKALKSIKKFKTRHFRCLHGNRGCNQVDIMIALQDLSQCPTNEPWSACLVAIVISLQGCVFR